MKPKFDPSSNSVAGRYDAAADFSENIMGRRLAELRKNAGLTLREMAENMAQYGIRITDKGINKWEHGDSVPNGYQLIAACLLLGVDSFMDLARGSEPLLDAVGMEKLLAYKNDLIATGLYTRRERPANVIDLREMPISLLTASAGTGQFLDDDSFEMQSFPTAAIPDRADFGLYLAGDSMEPMFMNGQLVWVQRCEKLRDGEVGIFCCDDEGFIKQYREQMPDEKDLETYTDIEGVVHPQIVLVSFNRAYAPRVITPDTDFRIIGRVVS